MARNIDDMTAEERYDHEVSVIANRLEQIAHEVRQCRMSDSGRLFDSPSENAQRLLRILGGAVQGSDLEAVMRLALRAEREQQH